MLKKNPKEEVKNLLSAQIVILKDQISLATTLNETEKANVYTDEMRYLEWLKKQLEQINIESLEKA